MCGGGVCVPGENSSQCALCSENIITVSCGRILLGRFVYKVCKSDLNFVIYIFYLVNLIDV